MEKSNDSQTATEPARAESEADFLADQAAAAQRAIAGTLERMRADLGDSADLAAWARRYPWPTMGIAAAAGFLAVMAVGSPASTRAAQSSAPPEESESAPSSRRARGRDGAAKDAGLLQSLLSELLRNFASAAQGALLAAIASRFQSPSTPPDNSPPVADPTVVGASDGNGFAPSDL